MTRRIVFFNRFFYPDTSATSQILTDLAFHVAATGREVHVVASGAADRAAVETVRGVAIHRVAKPAYGAQSIAGKAAAYALYYRGARRAALGLLRPGDTAVIETDPPMLSSLIVPIARRQGAAAVLWLQDIFPEVAGEYGIAGMKGWAGRKLREARDRSFAAAQAVVALGERMAERVASLGVVEERRLKVVHNWADGAAIVPVPHSRNALRDGWGLGGKFVVGYSGNLGRVHEFGTMLDAARILASRTDIVFLIAGRGPRHGDVRARVERDGLANVVFKPHQPRELLAQSLGAADVHLCILPPRFEGLVQPSKIYGILAAGRPTIHIGDPTGETGRILERSRAGVTVPTGDGGALAAQIAKLAADPAGAGAQGLNARRAFDECFDMRLALAAWDEILRAVGGEPPSR